MASVFEQVLLLFLFALVGFILSKTKRIDSSKVGLLSTLEFYVFVPLVSYQTFSQHFTVEYLKEKYPLVLISIGILVFLELFARTIASHLSKDRYRKLVYRYSLVMPNYGFFGYSLMQGLFGGAGLMDMMVFCLPMSIYSCTIGYAILTDQPGKFSFKKLLTPSIIAIALGAIAGITGVTLPNVLNLVVEKGAACMSPLGMLIAGIVISDYRFKDLLTTWQTYLICALRLLVIPAILFFLLKITNLQIATLTAIISYCCPCGLNPIIYGKLTGQDCRTAAGTTLLSTIFAMVTIPVCVYLFLS